MIAVSERAIEELKRVVEEQKQDGNEVFVRISIKGGGCSGYQHTLFLDEEKTDKDTVYETSGLKFVIDRASSLYLEGTKLDFIDDLNRRGFKFDNPSATHTCGCGKSFSTN